MKDYSKCIQYLPEITDVRVLMALMEQVDSYHISAVTEMNVWIDACERNIVDVLQQDKYIVSLFLLPLFLKTNRTGDVLSRIVYETIYHRLEKTEMDYEQWKKIDVLLPELPIEQSWDKCLRLKLAFKQ